MSQGDPILRVVPAPRDINANGHIFGGWVLAQMDVAGGILASNVAAGPVATVAIDAMEFIEPILLNDVIFSVRGCGAARPDIARHPHRSPRHA